MKNYSQSITRQRYCLNGIWDFACGKDGLDVLPTEYESVGIKVPSPYNVNGFMPSYYRNFCNENAYVQGGDFRLYPEYPPHWETSPCGFYRRSVLVPDDAKGQKVILRFDAVAFHCKIYCNGSLVRETMEGFLPIELDITSFVRFGEQNEIIVACESAGYLTYKGKDGKDRLDYPKGSFWGEHIAGIWQDAWLEIRPTTHLTDIFAVPDTRTNTLAITLRAENAQDCNVSISLESCFDNSIKQIIPKQNFVDSFEWHWQDGEVELWDFGQPNLYNLSVTLSKDGKTVDQKIVRIGFRSFYAEGEQFILNGKPIKLKSDAWHYLGQTVQTPEYARAYYKMALDAGVNIIRLHAQPYPEFFLDIADEMGMLIVSESAVWASHCKFSYSPDFFENSKKHLIEMILRDRNHPSVVMWSPENECIPAYMFCGSDYVKSIPELEEQLYDCIKIVYDYDTSRLMSCDGSWDLGGRLPVTSLHYPHYDCPVGRGKPITIGEMGSMYYSTPDTVSREFGAATLESFDGRLESVGREAYHDLIGQRKWASQICIFNLIWYGLRPLPFKDEALFYDDYTTPGIKPSRITPYMRTLNAGAQSHLPEYIPNPVWKLTQDAYIPTRTFAEYLPTVVSVGRKEDIHLTTFNDWREDAEFTLRATFTQADDVQKFVLNFGIAACGYCEDTIVYTPQKAGDITLTLELISDGKTVHSCEYKMQAVDLDILQKDFEKTGVAVVTEGDLPNDVPVLDCRNVAPFDRLNTKAAQQNFFSDNTTFSYARPVDCRVFDQCLCLGGIPCLTDGRGSAIALDLSCVGQSRIVSGLDLSADDGLTAIIRLELAKRLQNAKIVHPNKPYYLGDANHPATSMLTELGCDFEPITEEQLKGMLTTPTDRLLIIDGNIGFDSFNWFSRNNFSKVLLVGTSTTPKLFSNEFDVVDRKLFHLKASGKCKTLFGLDSNALYGLETNREQILADKTICCKRHDDGILLGVPDIDWRKWNHNAEPLKTVAILRGEQRDESKNTALLHRTYAGSDIYISTLSTDVASDKAKNIWARILSMLGATLTVKESDERSRLLYSAMYSGKVLKMLTRTMVDGEDIDCVNPALNLVENGSAWQIANGEERENALYALYITSPQDRRDLLMNPDYIDMHISAESDAVIYLNGVTVGKGCDTDITGLPLKGGVNRLVVTIKDKCKMPTVSFKRSAGLPLDLSFGLSEGKFKPIPMADAVFTASHNPDAASHANFTIEHFWYSGTVQEKGMSLSWSFPQSITAGAIWFACFRFENQNGVSLPKRFRLLAGEDKDNMSVIYESLDESKMTYPGGSVYIEFDRVVTAKHFTAELLDDAAKEWVMSDVTMLG